MSKIDTQGMSAPLSPEDAAKYKNKPQKHKPWLVTPNRLFSETYAKEMKILINEVLDEREYHRKLRMNYDDPTPPGVSYFDTEEFKHRIDEPEPTYPRPKKPVYRLDELQE